MGYRDRPSKKHVIWTRRTRDGVTKKRFDNEHFEKWASHYDFDFETARRTDHERADESRVQFRCVFSWGETESQSFEFGEEEWELAGQETPRTFVEIDEEGVARIKGWNSEMLCTITEMQFDGPTLRIKTSNDETKRVDGRELSQKPDE